MDRSLISYLEASHRVFWNWEITYECNYRCSYCKNWRIRPKTVNYDSSRWASIWDSIYERYGSCHLRFSGGEPTVFPNFFELVSYLSEKYFIDITTNLSFSLDIFFKKIKPDRISVSASFHPEVADIHEFTYKSRRLLMKGYDSTITCVAYPPFLYKLSYYKQVSEKMGIIFKISAFDGIFEKIRYPQGYTEKQRLVLKRLGEDTENIEQKEINTAWLSWETEGSKNDTPENKVCRMGEKYALIHTDGTVTRCCAPESPILGNITDKNFKLLDKPKPCKVKNCPCFKAMIVGNEERWMPFWKIR